jgi:hypothetical protein
VTTEDTVYDTEIEEDRASQLRSVYTLADHYRREEGLAGGVLKVADVLSLPTWLADSYLCRLARLADLPELALGQPLVQEIVTGYPERAHLRGAVVEINWKTTSWKSRGSLIFGKAGPTPKEYRECWTGKGAAPLFRVKLSLPYWMVADEQERRRLVHHELGHCTWKDGDRGNGPAGKHHDMEEFADTVARFGLMEDNEGQGHVAIAILQHPETEIRIRPWGGRQANLFEEVWKRSDIDADLDRHRRADPELARAIANLARPMDGEKVSVTMRHAGKSATITSDDAERILASLDLEEGKKPRRRRQKHEEPPAADEPSPGEKLGRLASLVGTVSDVDMAAMAGVSPAMVKHYRKQHGIPAYIEPEDAR